MIQVLHRWLTVGIVLLIMLSGVVGVANAQTEGESGGGSSTGGQAAPPREEPEEPAPPPAEEPEYTEPEPEYTEPEPEYSEPEYSEPEAQEDQGDPNPNQGPIYTEGGTTDYVFPDANRTGGTGEVWVKVDLSEQMIYVYRGDTLLDQTLIRSGKAGFETPVGEYKVHLKFFYDDMKSCENGECWDVPQVPFAMYFSDSGHALHGAYWADTWGFPASHGCVNLPLEFAEWLFSITPLGTKVIIQE